MTLNLNHRGEQPIVRCGLCPSHPILPTHVTDVDMRRCVRCQGEHRWLPLPHPDDHLCAVCRRECPGCGALTRDGQRCRACRGLCRTCDKPLPERPDPAEDQVRIEAPDRTDHRHKWPRIYFPRSYGFDLCPACRAPEDAVGVVLAALPEKVVHACGGNVPPRVIETIRGELRRHTSRRLVGRIERRWWGGWASRPLSHDPDGTDATVDEDSRYGPDDVAVWLLAPTACTGGCEDGWLPAADPGTDDAPCPRCRGGRLLAATRRRLAGETDAGPAGSGGPGVADSGVQAAIAARPPITECTGRDGACGLPVADGYRQCPACLGWPTCSRCGRRRYDPQRASACRACAQPTGPKGT